MTTKYVSDNHTRTWSNVEFDDRGNSLVTSTLLGYPMGTWHVGQDMPSFRSVILNRGDAINPFYGERGWLKKGHGRFSTRLRGISNTWAGSYPGTTTNISQGELARFAPISAASWNPAVYDQALSELVTQIQKVNRQFQGGVFLGELRQTVNLIRHPLRSLANGVSDYAAELKKVRHRYRKSGSLRRRKVVSDTWLEYSFGWVPLLSDIDDGARALAKYGFRPPPIVRVRSKESLVTPVGKNSLYLALPGAVLTYDVVTNDELVVHMYAGVKAAVPASNKLSYFGVSLDNFVPTLWELIPWSFLVDYFSNVQEIVNAYSMVESSIVYSGSTVTGKRIQSSNNWQLTVEKPPFSPGVFLDHASMQPDLSELSWQNVNRFKIPSYVPSLRFNIGGLGTRWLNVAALASRFTKLIPF